MINWSAVSPSVTEPLIARQCCDKRRAPCWWVWRWSHTLMCTCKTHMHMIKQHRHTYPVLSKHRDPTWMEKRSIEWELAEIQSAFRRKKRTIYLWSTDCNFTVLPAVINNCHLCLNIYHSCWYQHVGTNSAVLAPQRSWHRSIWTGEERHLRGLRASQLKGPEIRKSTVFDGCCKLTITEHSYTRSRRKQKTGEKLVSTVYRKLRETKVERE